MTPTIVVGYDGSNGAQTALRWALADAARRTDTRVHVVYASAPITYAMGYYAIAPTYSDDLEAARKAGVERIAEEVRRIQSEEGASDIQVDVEGVAGGVAQALLEAARDAALLVVGTRGHGGFAGLLLGSVSQACAHHAPCPVVIVPTPRT